VYCGEQRIYATRVGEAANQARARPARVLGPASGQPMQTHSPGEWQAERRGGFAQSFPGQLACHAALGLFALHSSPEPFSFVGTRPADLPGVDEPLQPLPCVASTHAEQSSDAVEWQEWVTADQLQQRGVSPPFSTRARPARLAVRASR
jgi:hypothetical protein